MAATSKVLDPYGRPVKRELLMQDIADASFGSVRSPISGYPGDGLDPVRLANILRAADQGDPVQYLELAETIEERDLHYLGVVGTRKRAVSQLEITVTTRGTTAAEKKHADALRDWLTRDELQSELFDVLDAVGKGYSFTEMIWAHVDRMTVPERLEWRDPRWFRFLRKDLRTPVMLTEGGQEEPLPPYKFIYAPIKAKSGLPIRGGLARPAAWAWMFKAFTQRDWAIFTQTYGQPIRVGKYGPGTSEEEKDTLYHAVVNIAGDCAAIMPDSMQLEFVEAQNISGSHELYEKRADWLDRQTSKAVLGQTATTDAVTGGLGSGKEHRQVQEDIETADANLLAGVLNQMLVRPFVDLNFGPQKRYPQINLARPEAEDLKAWTEAATPWIGLGLEVSESEVLAKLGFAAPKKGEKILGKTADKPPRPDQGTGSEDENPSETEFKGGFNALQQISGGIAALQAQQPSTDVISGVSPVTVLADRLQAESLPLMHRLLEQVEAIVQAGDSLEEIHEHLLSAFPELGLDDLVSVIAAATEAAGASGRAKVEDEALD